MDKTVFYTIINQKVGNKVALCLVDSDGFLLANGKIRLENKDKAILQLKEHLGIKRIKQIELSNETYKEIYKILVKELKAWEKWAARMDGMLDFHYEQYEKDKKELEMQIDTNKH
jgi:hypothetical protein